ncbi:lipid II flippase MurJ [Terrisporobacter sp.]|uniref:lipid II flippase MurJ n=1 Tax=Terrisporobacter sp. TaxID=1965305 RepID=UPI002631538E|nr:polysaccharide biosynthesis C-terminal domain-containing protein [Terrisporobacter sp.]
MGVKNRNIFKCIIENITSNPYVFSMINKVVSILVGIITTSLVNRYLGSSLRGEYAFVINLVNVVAVIGNLGLYQSYGNSKRKNMKNQMEEYLNIFSAQALIYMVLSLFMVMFVKSDVYIVALFLIPLEILIQQLGMIALVEFIKFRQTLNMIFIFVNLLLTLLVYIAFSPNIIFIMAISIIKNMIYIIAYIWKIRYIPNPLKINISVLISLIKFGFYPMITALLVNLNYKVDIFILKYHVDNTQVGLYSVGATLAEYAWLLPDAFKDVLFSKTAKDDSVEEIIWCIKVSMLFSLVAFVGIFIFGKLIINILYGSEFLNSYKVTCIIFLGIPSMALFKLIGPLYISKGEQKFYFYTLLLSVMANIILNIISIPLYGVEGAAMSSVISYSISGVVFFAKFVRMYNLNWYKTIVMQTNDIRIILEKINRRKTYEV